MPDIEFQCPSCGRKMIVEAAGAGSQVNCPDCGKSLTVPLNFPPSSEPARRHDVFISYAAADKPVADAACATLESRKIRCWIAPRDVVPGARRSWTPSSRAA